MSLREQAEVPAGHFRRVLMTRDINPLEPKVLEFKFYARGVGPVLAVSVSGGSDREELHQVPQRASAVRAVRDNVHAYVGRRHRLGRVPACARSGRPAGGRCATSPTAAACPPRCSRRSSAARRARRSRWRRASPAGSTCGSPSSCGWTRRARSASCAGRAAHRGAAGHRYEILTPPLPGQRAEVSRHALAPGAATGGPGDPPMHEPGARETAVVEAGAVRLLIDGAAHDLPSATP